MTNMLGDLWIKANGEMSQPKWQNLLANNGTKLHLYGKAEARKGRKMGHFCNLADVATNAQQQAEAIFKQLAAD